VTNPAEDLLIDASLPDAATRRADRAVGTVTSAAPLLVEIVEDHPEAAVAMAGLTVQVGDRVPMLRFGPQWLAIGVLD
jgi:hypothetical protein